MRRRVTRFSVPFALTAAALLIAMTLASSAEAAGSSSRPDCGKNPIRKSTGGYWQCSWADDFGGSGLDGSKWVAQRTDSSGFTDGMTSCFVDSPDNVSVSNGSLRLTTRQESAPFYCADPLDLLGSYPTSYTSGMVSTWGRFSQAYGRFEIRAKVPPAEAKGLQTSLWLWPVDASRYGSFPASGEIDIAEMYSGYRDHAMPYIHYNPAGSDPNVTSYNCVVSNLDSFHTYALEWTPSNLKIIYDGQTCLVDNWDPAAPLTAPQPFDQPFLIALTQGLGTGDNAFNPSTTPLPATTDVDYVRVWK